MVVRDISGPPRAVRCIPDRGMLLSYDLPIQLEIWLPELDVSNGLLVVLRMS
jgi:hypothetical protein